MTNEEGIPVKCTRKDCPNHTKGWNYAAEKRYPELVCCPKCGNKVRLPKEANTK